MYKILIVGLRGVDSGKTTLSLAVLSHMRDLGIEACGFKPMAGNNIWYNYDTIYKSLSKGRLFGNDARLLAEASVGEVPVELINPVHRLWAEPSSIDPSSRIPRFILDRVTLWNKEAKNILIENETLNLERMEFLDVLYRNAEDVYRIGDLQGFNDLVRRYYDRAIESAYRRLAGRYEAIVVEGYSDASLPWGGLDDLDAVVGVEPWRISAYDPDKYLDAVRLSVTSYSKEVATRKIIDLLKPVEVIDYPLFKFEERVNGLKELVPPILDFV